MIKNRFFLIGMSRAGKTELGKKLAQALDMDFFDTDLEIKIKYKEEIPTLYEKFGEHKFREIEFDILQSFANTSNAIISTGGGIVENLLSYEFLKHESQNYIALENCGQVIFIDTDPEIIFDRIEDAHAQGKSYPKFLGELKNTEDARARFYEVYKRRQNIYSDLANIHFKYENSIEEACKQLKNIILSDRIL